LRKLGKNFANLEREVPWSVRSLWNIFQNEFLGEILWQSPYRIWDETRKILAQTNEYSIRKSSNSLPHKLTFLSIVAMMNKKIIANIVKRI